MPTLVPSNEDVRVYEFAVMYKPDLDQKAESTLLSEIEGHFAEAQGKLLFKDPWSRRGLAYRIAGHDEAKFVIYYYELPPASIRELDRQLRLQKGVLRHLMLIPPKGYEAVSFEAKYQDWLKNRETIEDVRARKREEKTQKTVVDQAKRATKRLETKAKDIAKPVLKMQDLDSQLDKLIADSDLKL
ncbi:30S ribosomal protein S6 [Candidatus Peribacteria bacterium]|nr:30S ribosomal protein S6 [Candidatus Peribacteria bacterium]